MEEVVLEAEKLALVPKVAPKLLLNHIVMLVSLLLVERKICCVPRIWFQEKVSMEKKELVLMYFYV